MIILAQVRASSPRLLGLGDQTRAASRYQLNTQADAFRVALTEPEIGDRFDQLVKTGLRVRQLPLRHRLGYPIACTRRDVSIF